MQSQSNFVRVNGTDFYYEIAGGGHPLVLLHAGICDSRMWDDQFMHFAEHYQVIRYDMRGYGQTAMVDGPYAHRHDLYALLNYLGIGRTHLVGCSFGGTNCLDFALDHPEMVSGLVLSDSTPSGYQSSLPFPAKFAEVDAALEADDFDRAVWLEVEIWVDGPQRAADQVAPEVRQRVHTMNTIALKNDISDIGEAEPLNPPAAQRLHELAVPTLLVAGALDQPRTLKAIDWMATALPNAQKTIIGDAAHLPNMEQPAQFNQIIDAFLRPLSEQ